MLVAFFAVALGFLVADARLHGRASPMADGEGSELAGMIDVSGSRPGRTEGSALFYWFTPAQTTEAPEKQPLLIWLQGGPGSSGSLGLFFEVGPYYLNERLEIEDRTVGQWNRDFNVVFLDQPIGTGYSYAGKDNAYATNEDEVAQDLHYFLQQWYNLYPQYADCPVFLTGESYAGHYIPAFAYKILEKNGQAAASGDRVVPLAGAAIGDGLTDPCAQVEAGPRAAYDFGLIDQKTFAKAKAAALKASAACAKGNFTAAHDYREEMEAIVAVASGINMYDVRTFEDYSDIKNRMNVYLNDPATKQRLHVPADKPFLTDSQVAERLYDDVMQSQLYTFPSLLKNMRVMLYQGQFDWKDGPFSNEKWIHSIEWEGKAGYLAAPRKQWKIPTGEGNTALAGWVQSSGNLTELVINAAGHLAPLDQPERSYDMIYRFVNNLEYITK